MPIIWNGQVDGNFLNPANWIGNQVPAATDDVVIDVVYPIDQPSLQAGQVATVNRVLLSGGGALSIDGTLHTAGISATGLGSSLHIGVGGVLNGNVDEPESFSVVNAGTINGNVAFGPGDGYARLVNNGSIFGNVVFHSNLSNNLSWVYDNEFLNAGSISGVVTFSRGGVYKSTSAGPAVVVGSAFDERAELDRSSWTGSLFVDLRDGGGGRDIGDGTRLTFFDSLVVTGGSANDTFIGGSGADGLSGGDGDDVLQGRAGNDFIDGGPGSDTAVYSEISENVFLSISWDGTSNIGLGGRWEDRVQNVENFITGSGNDYLEGNLNDNRFEGNAGDDFFLGMNGKDDLDGGEGNDTASYADKSAGVFVVLNGATAVDVRVGGLIEDTLLNVENVLGGSGNDFFYGDALSNVFHGREGVDVLLGQGGNDVLIGDELDFSINAMQEQDYLYGGGGEDALYGGMGDDALFGEAGHDVLVGEVGNDYIDGGDGWDYADGGEGNDVFLMGAGNDTAMGHRGNDYFDLGDGDDFADGGSDELAGDNIFLGGNGDDVMLGGAGIDYFDAGSGDDFAHGGYGNDIFLGGDGDDVFVPGFGVDVALGGAGDDTYVVSIFDLYLLLVYDFAAGGAQDSILLTAETGFSNFAQVRSALSFNAANYATVLEVTEGASVWLVGVTPNQLTAADFLFA